jgi:hypothetical protein
MQSQHCKVLAFLGVLGLHRAARWVFMHSKAGKRGCLQWVASGVALSSSSSKGIPSSTMHCKHGRAARDSSLQPQHYLGSPAGSQEGRTPTAACAQPQHESATGKAAAATAALRQGPAPVVDVRAQLPVVPALDREAGGAAIGFQAALTGFLQAAKQARHPAVTNPNVAHSIFSWLSCIIYQFRSMHIVNCAGVLRRPALVCPPSSFLAVYCSHRWLRPSPRCWSNTLQQQVGITGWVSGGQLAADTSCLEAHSQLTHPC